MQKLPVSVGILSYKAHKTIDHTLTQYGDFLTHFEEAKVFFQCVSEADQRIAEKHKIAWQGRPDNIGIQSGMRWVVENLNGEYILYMENDFQLLYDVKTAVREIEKALDLVRTGRADIVRLRSRFNAGEPFNDVRKYTHLFKPVAIHPDFRDFHKIQKTMPMLKYLRPGKARRLAARALYLEKEPEKLFPKIIKKDGDFYFVDSAYLNWTNNPTIVRKDLFLKLLDYADAHPSHRTVNGMQDLEKPLNCRWWQEQHLTIAIGNGIFIHNRLDR